MINVSCYQQQDVIITRIIFDCASSASWPAEHYHGQYGERDTIDASHDALSASLDAVTSTGSAAEPVAASLYCLSCADTTLLLAMHTPARSCLLSLHEAFARESQFSRDKSHERIKYTQDVSVILKTH